MTSDRITQIMLAVLSLAWIGDFVRGMFQRGKVKADTDLTNAGATQVIVASTTTLLKPLQERIDELEAELRTAKKEVNKLVTQLQASTAENRRVTQENRMVSDENRRLRARLGEVPS